MDEFIVLAKKQVSGCNDENEGGERKRLSMSEWGCIRALSSARCFSSLWGRCLESSEWACLRNCLMRMILFWLQKQFKELLLGKLGNKRGACW